MLVPRWRETLLVLGRRWERLLVRGRWIVLLLLLLVGGSCGSRGRRVLLLLLLRGRGGGGGVAGFFIGRWEGVSRGGYVRRACDM